MAAVKIPGYYNNSEKKLDMLSRVANNLIWLNRYMERGSGILSLLKVNFYANQDSPELFSWTPIIKNFTTSENEFYTEDAIFTGTDATERWDKPAFMKWAKPIFERGRAWNFTALERHIYFDKTGNVGWFDELLNTEMKICRGSGVLIKEGNNWKLKQYILSTTIPNDKLDEVIKIKAPIEDKLIQTLKK